MHRTCGHIATATTRTPPLRRTSSKTSFLISNIMALLRPGPADILSESAEYMNPSYLTREREEKKRESKEYINVIHVCTLS